MILDGDEIKPCAIRHLCQLKCMLHIFSRWIDADAEKRRVIRHICHDMAPLQFLFGQVI